VRATGSGFFISADGYIVTNNHVVEGAQKITVRTRNGRALPARVVGRDPATDLAVLKVDGDAFPFVSFEDRARPRVGDWVVAVGNPFGLGGTATAGIVSALGRRNVSQSSFVDYMQIDAPINRGNSGGPTFDIYGRVVGVNTAIFSPSGGSVGIGFDIPADVAARISHQLVTQGKIVRGYMGATIQDVTPEIAQSLGAPAHQGALVADLMPEGPAQKAGLQSGDVVLGVGGKTVASAADLTRQIGMAGPDETVVLRVRREGRTFDLPVRLGVRPSEAQLASALSGGGGDLARCAGPGHPWPARLAEPGRRAGRARGAGRLRRRQQGPARRRRDPPGRRPQPFERFRPRHRGERGALARPQAGAAAGGPRRPAALRSGRGRQGAGIGGRGRWPDALHVAH
jgi:serine protease Do